MFLPRNLSNSEVQSFFNKSCARLPWFLKTQNKNLLHLNSEVIPMCVLLLFLAVVAASCSFADAAFKLTLCLPYFNPWVAMQFQIN